MKPDQEISNNQGIVLTVIVIETIGFMLVLAGICLLLLVFVSLRATMIVGGIGLIIGGTFLMFIKIKGAT